MPKVPEAPTGGAPPQAGRVCVCVCSGASDSLQNASIYSTLSWSCHCQAGEAATAMRAAVEKLKSNPEDGKLQNSSFLCCSPGSGHLQKSPLHHALAVWPSILSVEVGAPMHTTAAGCREISAGGRASPQDDGQDSATDVADVRASKLSAICGNIAVQRAHGHHQVLDIPKCKVPR